jgi:hypothetical protein
MNTIRRTVLIALLLLSGLGSAIMANAQDTSAPSLQEFLKGQYKLALTGADSSGFKIIEPGTVLSVLKAGVIATPQTAPHAISIKLPKVCNNTFKAGNLTESSACAKTTIGSRFLDKGEKVYVTKLEVNLKSNKITFNVVECDSCNGKTGKGSMKATVIFDFTEGFLEKADPGQVTDVISQLLGPG